MCTYVYYLFYVVNPKVNIATWILLFNTFHRRYRDFIFRVFIPA